jgi:shikimate kinase
MKNGKASEVVVENGEQAFRKFEDAVRQSLTVSKKEIMRREKAAKQRRAKARSR